jgi:membrane protein required for colicin V production
MIWIDFVIIGVLFLSALFGLIRGMFKEVLSLLTWIMAYVLAQSFWPAFDFLLMPLMSEVPSIRAPLAWGVLFVCSILVGSLIQRLVLELVRVTGLTGSDRALGAVFGLLRGIVIIVLVLSFVPLLIDFSEDAWWQASQLIPVFSALNDSVMLAINALIQLIQGIRFA